MIIGCRLHAVLSQLELENDDAFCKVIGLERNKYALSACELGYPETSFVPPSVNYPNYGKTVVFLE